MDSGFPILPMGKVWSLDFLGINYTFSPTQLQCLLLICAVLTLNHKATQEPSVQLGNKSARSLSQCQLKPQISCPFTTTFLCLLLLQDGVEYCLPQDPAATLEKNRLFEMQKSHRCFFFKPIGSMYGIFTYIYQKKQPFM